MPSCCYLFVYVLIVEAVSSSGNEVWSGGMIVNNELKRIWKEVIMVLFKVLTQHFHGGTTENHKQPQDSQSVCSDMKPGLPEYEAGGTTHLTMASYISMMCLQNMEPSVTHLYVRM
jgi:hypothetical protein